MNFIVATIELRSHSTDTIDAYGLEYRGASAAVPGNSSDSEVRLPTALLQQRRCKAYSL